MAIYEYYCPECRERFSERRSMSQVAVATTCKMGHPAEKTVSMFAVAKSGGGFDSFGDMSAEASGGGCCGGGGGCACGN